MSARNRAARSGLFAGGGYSTVWEDERVIEHGLRPTRGERVLSITSGGCSSLQCLLFDAGEVVSIDLSTYQTALLQLKCAAVRTLSHSELWELLGLTPSVRRRELYARARSALPGEFADYWDARPSAVAAGVTLSGGHDRRLHFIGWCMTMIQGRRRMDRLLACADLDEQRSFVDGEWNTRRWRAVLRIALGRTAVARAVRDGERDRVITSVVDELDHLLRDVAISENFYLYYLFRRTYPSPDLCPAWLRADSHAVIRDRLERVTTRTQAVEDFLASPSAGTFDCYNMSNVFDWMTPQATEHLLAQIVRAARPGARLCYWTNTVNKPLVISPDRFPEIVPLRELSAELTASRRAPGSSGCVVARIDR